MAVVSTQKRVKKRPEEDSEAKYVIGREETEMEN